MRAGSSGEERRTPHYTVPVSPQCPQEISLLPCQCSRAQRSPASASRSLFRPVNVAKLGGSPPLRGSLEQLDRPSPAGPPLPGHRASRSKYTRGQSQETGSLSKSSGGVGALAKRVVLGPA